MSHSLWIGVESMSLPSTFRTGSLLTALLLINLYGCRGRQTRNAESVAPTPSYAAAPTEYGTQDYFPPSSDLGDPVPYSQQEPSHPVDPSPIIPPPAPEAEDDDPPLPESALNAPRRLFQSVRLRKKSDAPNQKDWTHTASSRRRPSGHSIFAP